MAYYYLSLCLILKLAVFNITIPVRYRYHTCTVLYFNYSLCKRSFKHMLKPYNPFKCLLSGKHAF